jgi:hypothetical protein
MVASVHWRLSLSDLGAMMFLLPKAAALRTESPHSWLSTVAGDAARVNAALKAGDANSSSEALRAGTAHAGRSR